MVDLQRKQKPSYGGLIVVGVGVAAVALLGGGYWAWGQAQQSNVRKVAAGAANAGMAISREQARARISVAEAGAHLADWTETDVSPSGFSCYVLNRGDTLTGYAWEVCGIGDDLSRVAVGPRRGGVAANTPEAQAMMRRLLEAAAPEVSAETKAQVVSEVPNLYGKGLRGEALVGGATITLSTDREGAVRRMIAAPVG